MSKDRSKTQAPDRPALALSRGLFGFRAGGAASPSAPKAAATEGDGARRS